MLWEQMVTDGHVRAARLRRVQPWIIALGLVLLWAGMWVVHAGPQIRPSASLVALLQERLAQAQQRSSEPFARLPPLAPGRAELERLPSAGELPELVETIRRSLNDSGRLPTKDVDFTELTPESFFGGPWEPEHVLYLKSGNSYLLGAQVHRGSAASPQPVRWIGVMKRLGGQWQYATVLAGGSGGLANLPSVAPQNIALTLQPFLPPPPPAPPARNRT